MAKAVAGADSQDVLCRQSGSLVMLHWLYA
jgi:hypothetical protein